MGCWWVNERQKRNICEIFVESDSKRETTEKIWQKYRKLKRRLLLHWWRRVREWILKWINKLHLWVFQVLLMPFSRRHRLFSTWDELLSGGMWSGGTRFLRKKIVFQFHYFDPLEFFFHFSHVAIIHTKQQHWASQGARKNWNQYFSKKGIFSVREKMRVSHCVTEENQIERKKDFSEFSSSTNNNAHRKNKLEEFSVYFI